ncbi:MAG TPA: 2Fe-2S iron-sulfur cluster-binding protein [Noviherbaspirillum sp.]|nr:2Fe-2S iron-sulfur cluster-binding protein [Noviherbaspirillum sp.]
MPQAVFVSPSGEEHVAEVPVGWSLMEAAREDGIEGVVAECGGGAICGTCHVKVEPKWFALLAQPQMMEAALLEAVPERSETSRLACQIMMSEELDGVRVHVPSEQLEL